MKKRLPLLALLLLLGLSVWLFLYDEAAEPGPLTRGHQQAADCSACHVPWRGVAESQCLACHAQDQVNELRPALRFHAEKRYCLRCHRLHGGSPAERSRMDHTLLNGDISCGLCHLDPHGRLFGQDCRACHGLRTWRVDGYRHPPAKDKNCARCHRPPSSHGGGHYQTLILGFHLRNHPEVKNVPVDDCWRCHVTHDWRHLRMSGYRQPTS
ncbi:MAG: hypothetical protein KQJ78_14430 [Deltaproteobacteria bacterium]|nr:hypothetical protein [Deltaproteobacteria bacterium]